LDYIRSHGNALQPSNKKQLDACKKVASQPLNVKQLGALAMVPVDNGNAGLTPMKPLTGNPLDTTCAQFGTFNQDWYFTYGNCGQFVFTLAVFAFPVCNPEIAKKNGLALSDAHLFQIAGGVGIPGQNGQPGQWFPIPPGAFTQGIYQCTTQGTFSWTAVPTPDSSILSASLVSATLGAFQFNVKWIDPTGIPRAVSASFVAQNPPSFNGPRGCNPLCLSGAGSLYWSYTNLIVNAGATFANSAPLTGTGRGWTDHQWMQNGKLTSNLMASLRNLSVWTTPGSIGRWLWINIQDEVAGRQYMIYVPIGNGLVELGKTYTPNFNNLYDNSTGVHRLPQNSTKVTVSQMFTFNNYTFPTQYQIHIDIPSEYQKTGVPSSVDYTLTSTYGNTIMYTPLGVAAWEGSGSLVNKTTGDTTGFCFLEANFMAPTCQLWKTWTAQAGITGDDAKAFAPSTVQLGAGLLSTLYLASILGVIILFFVLVVYLAKKAHKSIRQTQTN